jgi:hypothetical protein
MVRLWVNNQPVHSKAAEGTAEKTSFDNNRSCSVDVSHSHNSDISTERHSVAYL